MYAEVVLGLAVPGPFDYLVPKEMEQVVREGSRVEVNFNFKKRVGYIVGLKQKSAFDKIKPLARLLDNNPALSKNMLLLAKAIAEYYCCSWGEAIETVLPGKLRENKIIDIPLGPARDKADSVFEGILIHSRDNHSRWEAYSIRIKKTLEIGRSAIVVLPDAGSIPRIKEMLGSKFDSPIAVQCRGQADELDVWGRIKQDFCGIVLGTRSSVFAPLDNLGLIIVDQEEEYSYKQDQVPHYHVRDVALMRGKIDKTQVILGSPAPCLESIHSARTGSLAYQAIPGNKPYPEVKILDSNRIYKDRSVISKYLEDLIISNLTEKKGKTLLFLNRKGFATAAFCQTCGKALKCPRCNINLVYHFKAQALACHYCSFKIEPIPKICPDCNSGYIKYSGMGTEKMESELSRIFPQARIKIIGDDADIDINSADIFIATQRIIRHVDLEFDLVGVLSIDNTLNHIDLRSSEKAYAILSGLAAMAGKVIFIQTGFPKHHVFMAIEKNNPDIFYDEELKQRKTLKFPPFSHLAYVKLRGAQESKVKDAAGKLFIQLGGDPSRGVHTLAVNPGINPKLRGNFYWQILVASDNPKKISNFLKLRLKNFRHSGIIVTVDVDPA